MKSLALAAALLAISAPAMASSSVVSPLIIRPGSAICSNFFATKEAAIAVKSGDDKWLAETGCWKSSAEEDLFDKVIAVIEADKRDPTSQAKVRAATSNGVATVFVEIQHIFQRNKNGKWVPWPCGTDDMVWCPEDKVARGK